METLGEESGRGNLVEESGRAILESNLGEASGEGNLREESGVSGVSRISLGISWVYLGGLWG